MRGDAPAAVRTTRDEGRGTAIPVSENVIDGAAIAARVLDEVRSEVDRLKVRGVTPGLSVVLVGDDQASAVYVRSKESTSRELGMAGETIRLPASTSEAELLAIVDRLNASEAVHGILVQMPVPEQIDPKRPVAAICASGQRSAVAASLLSRYGAEQVLHVVGGGVGTWARAGHPMENGAA